MNSAEITSNASSPEIATTSDSAISNLSLSAATSTTESFNESVLISMLNATTFYAFNSTNGTALQAFSGVTSVFLAQYILIILGFLVGHFKLLSKAQSRGLGLLVQRYALFGIFFMVTSTLRLDEIRWPVIGAIFVTRLVIFLISIVTCLVVSRCRQLGLAAMLGLLLTDTNDIAVIYPTFRILYPSMANHCCLLVVLSMLLLRPIAFFLLELNSVRERRMVMRFNAFAANSVTDATNSTPSLINPRPPPTHMTYRTLIKLFCQVLLDPQLLAFSLGIICNAAFKNHLPDYVQHFFNTFGETFIACSLFYLGLVCMNPGASVSARMRPLLVITLLVKVLVMPLLAVKILEHIPNHISDSTTKGFVAVYFLSPASANLLQVASSYAVAPNLVADSIGIGTFLLLPVLFVYEGVQKVTTMDPVLYTQYLEKTAIFVSWISTITGIWARLVFIAGRKTRQMPHRLVICYLDFTLVTTGMVAITALYESWIFDPNARVKLLDYIRFSFYLSAFLGSRIMIAFIGIAMLIQHRDGIIMPRRNRTVFYIFGLLTPIILTVSMKIVSHDVRHLDVNPFNQNGRVQQTFTLAVLMICFLTTVVALIMFFCTKTGSKHFSCYLRCHTKRRKVLRYRPRSTVDGYTRLSNGSAIHDESREPLTNHTENNVDGTELTEVNLYDEDHSIGVTREPIKKPEDVEDPNNRDGQIHRHFVLVGLNLVGMIFGMYACFWRLLYVEMTSSTIMMEFFDQVFNFGQGFLVFSLYGSDVECMARPILRACSKLRERITLWFLGVKRSRRSRRGTESGEPDKSIKPPTRQTSNWRIAESFALRYLHACAEEICKPIELRSRTVERAFVFADFREWLFKRNLCSNLEEVMCLLLALELNDYVRGLSIPSVYNLDPETCSSIIFEFIMFEYP